MLGTWWFRAGPGVSAPIHAAHAVRVSAVSAGDMVLDAGGVVVGLLVVVGIVLAATLAAFATRRWLLRRRWATFECSVRDCPRSFGRGWSLGVGAYGDGVLRWYRLFSLRPRPLLVLDRRRLEITDHRQPVGVESRALVSGHVVVAVSQDHRVIELAMKPAAVTSFTAWLETASRV